MTDLEESYQHCYNHKAVDDCVRATVYHNCDSGVIFLCGIKNNLLDLLGIDSAITKVNVMHFKKK